MIGYAAHLRIYEPVSALPDGARRQWHDYVEAGQGMSRPLLMAREHEAALAAAIVSPPRMQLGDDAAHAYVRHLDGRTYVCPWWLQVRAWDALEEFRASVPDEIAEAFVPTAVALGAEMEHEAWAASHPDVRVGILTSTWQVPLPWFTLFEAEERRLVLGERRAAGAPPHTGLDRALVYLTAMSRARRRVAKALHVVQRVVTAGSAAESLEGVGRWLEDFHPHSLVELDYGGLVHLVDDETLAADSSVAEVSAALDCLAAGDGAGAGEIYERVATRWAALGALEHAN